MWIPHTKLRSSGLVASAITLWAISLALRNIWTPVTKLYPEPDATKQLESEAISMCSQGDTGNSTFGSIQCHVAETPHSLWHVGENVSHFSVLTWAGFSYYYIEINSHLSAMQGRLFQLSVLGNNCLTEGKYETFLLGAYKNKPKPSCFLQLFMWTETGSWLV